MKKIAYIALIATAVLTSACKGFLVEEPYLSQSNALALIDYNALDKAVAGAYAPLADGTWYGANYVLDSEMRADNATIPTSTTFQSGRLQTSFYMTYSADATSSVWGYGYYVISAANNVLEAIEENGMEQYAKLKVTEQDVKNLQAECYFLRALAMFDLARLYAYSPAKAAAVNFNDCIPIVLKTDKTAKEQPARNSVSEVYAQIISDLTTAESLMAADYARAGVTDKKAAASLPAIQALLSRVYLYDQNWQGAADYATKVINNKAFKLWTAAEYPSVWGANVGGSEVIFEVFGHRANEYDEYWEGPSHMTNPLGYGDAAASKSLTSLFEPGDVRGTTGVRGADDGKVMFCTDKDEASGGELWTMKYYGKGLGDATSTPDFNNVIVLRLSEMYLNRAEALVNGATVSGVSALDDLNAIRANRNATPLTVAGAAAVALERRLELNFEGHYWFDLGRTASGAVAYSDSRRGAAVDATSKFWALPIPKREYDVNENLTHNPGF
ncbi:MAG: RagB/SusD family nutrient uptake outer membrane protein [Bacteroidales bacterium]|nr:RagB/SusD family nutrient uptake outer membrane protein [Bacteroidales bacterium]